MQITMNKFIGLVGVLVVFLVTGCANRYSKRVSLAEYPFLKNPHSQDVMVWRQYEGPDFYVFYGEIKSIKGAGVSFYRGGHPMERTHEEAAVTEGRLGVFEVTWFQTADPKSGMIYRQTIFDYSTRITKWKQSERESRYVEKVHATVYGKNEQELGKLTEYLGGIELFRDKPKDTIISY